MKQLEMKNLTVWHRLRDNTGAGMSSELRTELQRHCFYVATCMREFGVMYDADPAPVNTDADTCLLYGQEAYAFLLRTVTGLNSSIPGETNVQGQVRKAWDTWRHEAGQAQVAMLNPVMHHLFTDSRTVRRQYLEGIGGTAYGSLVRKLMQPAADAKILFVGAGELAQSVAPYFSNQTTAVWNRHATDPAVLGAAHAFAPGDREAAASWATHVIMTTPPDSQNDAHWASLLSASTHLQQIVHLGLRRAQRGAWQSAGQCSDLDDLIELRQTQTSLRAARLKRAHQACDKIAGTRVPLSNDNATARAA